MKFSAWENDEVKKLFKLIEEFKACGKSVSSAFYQYAKLSGRKSNSVRNYYYAQLKEFENNSKKAKMLEINLELHDKSPAKSFSKAEEKAIFEKISEMVKKGYSVRKACLELSGGNVTEMLRLQNKYRSLKTNMITENKAADNITFMKPRGTTLTDKEINSLFMGLVRLVKKSAIEEVNKSLKSEAEFANNTLRKTLVNLSNKEKEYSRLRMQFDLIKQENEKLLKELENIKCNKAESLSKNMKKLKEFKFKKSEGLNATEN